jgi:DNA polymerase-3 subunit delta
MHATQFLQKPDASDIPPIVVLHGSEAFLKEAARKVIAQRVFGAAVDADAGPTRLAGKDAEWRRVRDELSTVSMFGDQRVVIVEEADDFVSEHRDALESYFDKPSRQSVFVLDVKTWRNNTRLAKKLANVGLELDCSELKGPALQQWLAAHAKNVHGKQLTRDAAALMVELAGAGLSLMEQELAKLAAYAGDRDRISVDDVRAVVGGWKAETTWRMTDAVRDGKPEEAIAALGKLLHAGEASQKILGGVTYVFRKYARATELARDGVPLRAALQQAGVFPRDIDASERYLRRLGRQRAEFLRSRLLEADRGLKGGSRVAEQLQLELLLLEFSGANAKAAQAAK